MEPPDPIWPDDPEEELPPVPSILDSEFEEGPFTTCVACHSQQDCLRCHTQINPHGPDFKPETWRNRNETVCLTCHTGGIPGGI